MGGSETTDWPATALLRGLMTAVAEKDVPRLGPFFSSDVEAVLPAADPAGPIDKVELVSWLEAYCAETGTMRLDLTAVVHGSSDSVGAVVTHTAFKAPPDKSSPPSDDEAEPYWFTVPTIAGANSNESGTQLNRFFLVTDDERQPNRSTMMEVVRGWYTAYVEQDVEGFMAPLADDLEAYSFNDYGAPTAVSKSAYHKDFLDWAKRNRKGGFIVSEMVVRGRYVGVAVQFLTEARSTGQQKMTNEIHLIELDDRLQMRRAYYYETDRCGYPSSPCCW